MIFECSMCENGKVFDGIMMHSNPYDYGDYDEIWSECLECEGTGKVWFIHPKEILLMLKRKIEYRISISKEEIEIPF